MCKDSADAVINNFNCIIPIYAILQTEFTFECFCMERKFNQVYNFVSLFKGTVPKDLSTFDNVNQLLQLGIYMLTLRHFTTEQYNSLKNHKSLKINKSLKVLPTPPYRGDQNVPATESKSINKQISAMETRRPIDQGEFSYVEFSKY